MIDDNTIYNKEEEKIIKCPNNCKNKDTLCKECIDYSQYVPVF